MPYKTQTRKGYNGWEATSEAVIGETESGTRILKLRTAKTRGGIASTASVCERQNRDGAFYAEVTAIFGDFYKSNIAPVACNRVTEKAVIAAHTGKTTFANALLAQDDFLNERIVLIEDTPELQCSAEDKVEMLTKRTQPVVTMRDLVMTTLRMRPDRIIVGEVRDGSALDMLKAWNTGHPGGIATIHANSAYDALGRIEDLVGEVSAQVSHRAIASAIDLVVFMCRTSNGPKIQELVQVDGYEGGRYVMAG